MLCAMRGSLVRAMRGAQGARIEPTDAAPRPSTYHSESQRVCWRPVLGRPLVRRVYRSHYRSWAVACPVASPVRRAGERASAAEFESWGPWGHHRLVWCAPALGGAGRGARVGSSLQRGRATGSAIQGNQIALPISRRENVWWHRARWPAQGRRPSRPWFPAARILVFVAICRALLSLSVSTPKKGSRQTCLFFVVLDRRHGVWFTQFRTVWAVPGSPDDARKRRELTRTASR